MKPDNASSGQILSQRNRVLAHLLAETDAIWEPQRWVSAGPITYQRRRLFREAGVQWPLGIVKASRTNVPKLIADLHLGRLVELNAPHGRTLHARLTDLGDATARKVCGPEFGHPASLADSLAAVTILAGLHDHPDATERDGKRWVRETIAGAFSTDKAVQLEFLLTPALVAGVIESAADAVKRIWYSCPQHWPPKDLTAPSVAHELYDESASELYNELQLEASRALRSTELEDVAEIGLLPMSCNPETIGDVAARNTLNAGVPAKDRK